MLKNNPDIEISSLVDIAGHFPRYRLQVNKLLNADAEIIDFRNKDFQYLVLKSDSIKEEIKTALYEDPFLIGWMAVTVTISDLAAVGADPFGILLSLQLPNEYADDWLKEFQRGVNEACATYKVFVLGGDTNFDHSVSVTSTGVATINHSQPMLRKGMAPGDLIYATGKLGQGNAYAYNKFFDPCIEMTYKPMARLKESKCIRRFATACIDTSDGLFPALSVLSAVNHVGMQLSTPIKDILHDTAFMTSKIAAIPSWMMLAGPHGEYELLFTVSPGMKHQFEDVCYVDNRRPVLLGEITGKQEISFLSDSTPIRCHPAVIPNLFHEANDNIPYYFELLKKQHQQWCV